MRVTEARDGGREHPVDQGIRQDLEPDSLMIKRVVGIALGKPATRAKRSRWLLAATVATAAAIIVLLVWPSHREPSLSPDHEASASIAPCYEIRNIGDLVVVRSPTGQVLAMTSGGAS